MLSFVQTRIASGELDAVIEFVFSNREPGEAEGSDLFFRLVQDYGLPLVTLSSARFAREQGQPFRRLREDYDRRVIELLSPYKPDLCMLAGYMLIASGLLCRRYPLLNLHPALPDGPIGTWQQVIWSLIENRSSVTGAMVHLATEEVDRGPVIAHFTAGITGPPLVPLWNELEGLDLTAVKEDPGEEFPLFRLIREAEFRKEPYLLLETLRAVSEGRVLVENGQVRYPAGQSPEEGSIRGLNLDREILRAMQADGLEPAV